MPSRLHIRSAEPGAKPMLLEHALELSLVMLTSVMFQAWTDFPNMIIQQLAIVVPIMATVAASASSMLRRLDSECIDTHRSNASLKQLAMKGHG